MNTIQHNGRTFTVRIEHDDCGDAPWDRGDCHGVVRCVRVYGGLKYEGLKRPGERILHSDGWTYWLYDWQATCKKAREVWGCTDIHAQVSADFERMGAWLRNDWSYVGVIVTPDDDPDAVGENLWGIESDCTEYIQQVAQELAEQCEPAYVHVVGV